LQRADPRSLLSRPMTCLAKSLLTRSTTCLQIAGWPALSLPGRPTGWSALSLPSRPMTCSQKAGRPTLSSQSRPMTCLQRACWFPWNYQEGLMVACKVSKRSLENKGLQWLFPCMFQIRGGMP
jgi:hypothetical protein